MSAATTKSPRAVVHRTLISGKKAADSLATLKDTCTAGKSSTEVQGSPITAQACNDMEAAVTTAATSQGEATALALKLAAARKKARKDRIKAETTLTMYETAVNGLADGDATVIAKAGLPWRYLTQGETTVAKVTKLHCEPGKMSKLAELGWGNTPGAAMYGVQVRFDTTNPDAPWISLGTVTRRTKIVEAPAPGAQFQARVVAMDSDGVPSEWSDAILCVAR